MWDYVRQNDEVEKLKKKIAHLEEKNKELREELRELRNNIEPLPIPWRENGIFTQVAKNQLLQNINGLVPPQECKDINLFVTGSIGSGKSSLVNTFLTVLRNNGQLATIAQPANNYRESTSPVLHEIVLHNTTDTKRMRVYDCRGIIPAPKPEQHKEDNRSQAYMEDIINVIHGHVIKDYTFNDHHAIKKDSGFYRNKPTVSDKMHCVLFVVRADILDEQTDVSVLHKMQQNLLQKNIPVRLVLSHVDKLDLCVFGDLTKIFVSKHVKDKVQLAKRIFMLQDSQILPIANYVEGITQNIAQDILGLQALENILNEALSYINNQICQ